LSDGGQDQAGKQHCQHLQCDSFPGTSRNRGNRVGVARQVALRWRRRHDRHPVNLTARSCEVELPVSTGVSANVNLPPPLNTSFLHQVQRGKP
jgi:hypothetical protein